MKVALISLTMTLMAACKTSNPGVGNAKLATNAASAATNPHLQKITGRYRFTGPDTQIYDLSDQTRKTAMLTIAQDGVVALDVHFAVAIRSSVRMDPGIIAAIIPDSKPRTETYVVGSEGFFGGSKTEERQIVTTGKILSSGADGHDVVIENTTVMYSRPYTWFSKLEWKIYRTDTERIEGDGQRLTYTQTSKELLGSQNLTLTFNRDG